MEKIGRQLSNCHQTYDAAMAKLSQGRGNLIAQAGQLTELGVQVRKELSRSVTEKADMDLKN
jgi:DNA recombination protein RmuC